VDELKHVLEYGLPIAIRDDNERLGQQAPQEDPENASLI
jgi:hypothetical protein